MMNREQNSDFFLFSYSVIIICNYGLKLHYCRICL